MTELESERAARLLLEELENGGEEEIFFGPVTDKEKLKSKKMRRKTEVFRPGFRAGCDGDEVEEGGKEIVKELEGMVSSSRELSDDKVPEARDITREGHSNSGHRKSGDSSSPSSSSERSCPTGENTASSVNGQSEENGFTESSGEDSKRNNGLFTQHTVTPSLAKRRPGSLEPSVNVNTPPFSLVTVSPQADAALIRENGGRCDCVELFNATESISVADCDLTAVGSGKDGSSSNQKDLILEETGVGIPFDETVGGSQRQCMNVDRNSDLSEVGNKADTDESDNLSPLASGQEGQAVKPTPCQTTGQSAVIYSSPLSISTSVQRVQMQQPLCYGSSMTHIPISVTNLNRMKNLAAESNFAHQTDSYSSEETSVAPSAFNPGNSAFGKPIRKVDDLVASQTKEFTHSQNLPQTFSALPQSPAANAGYQNQATSCQGHCSLPSSMLHKENVNPDRQGNTKTAASGSTTKGTTYKVISAVSSPVVSALCSKQPSQSGLIDAGLVSSPRVLQISNRQTPAASPSAAARQRLIDEKRALLARLRAEKQELRKRIKEDNEKCFNMKLENAAALQSNMARGMTPVFDRLPSQGCDGPAALTLTEREWEMVTKLHTMKNSQHASTDRTQSPCHQAMQHRDQPRLHWHEDLILNAEELSSPSRPRCKAKTILSKKGQNSVRNGIGLQPPSSSSSSSSSLHSGQPRARQHLLF